MYYNCKKCDSEMVEVVINSGDRISYPTIANKKVDLLVCDNPDCQEFGVPRIVSECPRHLNGHEFLPCDDQSPTCWCGKPADEN